MLPINFLTTTTLYQLFGDNVLPVSISTELYNIPFCVPPLKMNDNLLPSGVMYNLYSFVVAEELEKLQIVCSLLTEFVFIQHEIDQSESPKTVGWCFAAQFPLELAEPFTILPKSE